MHVEEPAREAFLYHLWLNRSFEDLNLQTIDGRPLQVLEKGTRNYDAGPDFLNALVKIDGDIRRGDVEVHPLGGDWYQHGHHRDPRYNHVVLHLVTMDCPAAFQTLAADGHRIPTLNMDSYLEKPADQLEYDFVEKPEPKINTCALAEAPLVEKQQVLQACGKLRLEIKAKRFAEERAVAGWDQIVFTGLADAMGYSKNQAPFRQLSRQIPVEKIWGAIWDDSPERARQKVEAYLFAASGLLPGHESQLPPDAAEYCRLLRQTWVDFPYHQKVTPMPAEAWIFFRLRPQNFPTRRIAALSALAAQFYHDGFIETFLRTFEATLEQPEKTAPELEALFAVQAGDFWRQRMRFDDHPTDQEDIRLVGLDRARDIVVNIVLPVLYAYAEETDDGRLRARLLECYQRYPRLAANDILRAMRDRLFTAAERKKRRLPGGQQQGMIHLYKNVCQSGDCKQCLK